MRDLRERLNLESDDFSQDQMIRDRKPIDNLRALSAWEIGDSFWADWFIKRMQDLGIEKLSELTSIF